MNDRLKFRIWHEGKMHYNDFVITSTGYAAKIDEEFLGKCVFNQENLEFNKQAVVMQCTGLKDKNGKLIYEGDIVQSEEYPFKNEKGYNYAAEVLWDDASATFYYYTFRISNNVAGRSTGNTGELNEYEDWKVIGNIYENKELLDDCRG